MSHEINEARESRHRWRVRQRLLDRPTNIVLVASVRNYCINYAIIMHTATMQKRANQGVMISIF